jgi:hypothetical protein
VLAATAICTAKEDSSSTGQGNDETWLTESVKYLSVLKEDIQLVEVAENNNDDSALAEAGKKMHDDCDWGLTQSKKSNVSIQIRYVKILYEQVLIDYRDAGEAFSINDRTTGDDKVDQGKDDTAKFKKAVADL